jgi:hypothetical protein
MGKDKKKSRDPSKQAALAAKKEAKAEKAALKRMAKSNSSVSRGDDEKADDANDIDAVLSSMMREVNVVEYETVEDFPTPPRGNFTWTLCPLNGMFYMVSAVAWLAFFPIEILHDVRCTLTLLALLSFSYPQPFVLTFSLNCSVWRRVL